MKPLKECFEVLDELTGLRSAGNKTSQEELAKLEKEDPYKHFLLTDPMGKAMCDIASQIPAHVWACPSKWNLPIDSSVPELQAAIQS